MSTFSHQIVCITSFAVAVALGAPSVSRAQSKNWNADQLSNPFPAPATEPELIETLRKGQPAEKAIACKQLTIYGSAAAVPELAKLLSDEQLSSWSRIALEAIPGPEADAALVEAAKKLKGQLLIGMINSLGVRRCSDAIDVLSQRLNEADEEVASAAAVALGEIGGMEAVGALYRAYGGATTTVRSAIAEGGILCAERFLANGETDRAVQLYDLVRGADVPQQRILEATRGAIIARGKQGIPLLIEQLQSPDYATFQIGLSTARELEAADIAAALAAELERLSPDRASLVVVAIGDRTDGTLPAAVLRAAKEGDKQVRLAAIGVVGRLGDTSTVPTLLEIAAGDDTEVAQAAKSALAQLPGDRINSELIGRLKASKGKTLAALVSVIGQRRAGATTELVAVLQHGDSSVRGATLAALGETIGPQDLNVLVNEVLAAKEAADVETAVRALQAASIRMPDREATAQQLAAALTRATDIKKAALLKTIGAVGGQCSLDTIAAAVKGESADLQDVGTRLLGEWMTADAAPYLYEIASSDHKYKTRALRGYLRIARQLNMPDADRLAMCRKALAIAERAEERELALEAMKRSPSAEAVELASSLLDDAELRDRAVETAVFIGEKIKDSNPAAAAAAGQKALDAAPPQELADRARALTQASESEDKK